MRNFAAYAEEITRQRTAHVASCCHTNIAWTYQANLASSCETHLATLLVRRRVFLLLYVPLFLLLFVPLRVAHRLPMNYSDGAGTQYALSVEAAWANVWFLHLGRRS